MQELLVNLEKPFNLWQIIAGLIAYNVIGMIWFGLFKQPWMTAGGFTKEMMEENEFKQKSRKYFPVAQGLTLICILGYSLFINALAATTLDVLIVALLLWITISMPQHSASVLWERRPSVFFFITAGHSLVSSVVIGYLLYFLK